jgi:hypothetical protein
MGHPVSRKVPHLLIGLNLCKNEYVIHVGDQENTSALENEGGTSAISWSGGGCGATDAVAFSFT